MASTLCYVTVGPLPAVTRNCACGAALTGKAQYCSGRCRQRRFRERTEQRAATRVEASAALMAAEFAREFRAHEQAELARLVAPARKLLAEFEAGAQAKKAHWVVSVYDLLQQHVRPLIDAADRLSNEPQPSLPAPGKRRRTPRSSAVSTAPRPTDTSPA